MGGIGRVMRIDIDLNTLRTIVGPVDTIDSGGLFIWHRIGKILFPIAGPDAKTIFRSGIESHGATHIATGALLCQGKDRVIISLDLYGCIGFRGNNAIAVKVHRTAQRKLGRPVTRDISLYHEVACARAFIRADVFFLASPQKDDKEGEE